MKLLKFFPKRQTVRPPFPEKIFCTKKGSLLIYNNLCFCFIDIENNKEVLISNQSIEEGLSLQSHTIKQNPIDYFWNVFSLHIFKPVHVLYITLHYSFQYDPSTKDYFLMVNLELKGELMKDALRIIVSLDDLMVF